MCSRPALCLKRILLLFRAAWLSLVFATNVLDAGKTVGLLGEDGTFASGNYRFLAETTARHGTAAFILRDLAEQRGQGRS
jgi:hypothetical protein